MAVDKSRENAHSSAEQSRRQDGQALSTASDGTQDTTAPLAQPPADLLALQRMIADRTSSSAVQASAEEGREELDPSGAHVHEAAREGTSGAGGPLPHLDQIQKSFGHHDVTDVTAHTDQKAKDGAQRMGAEAFASGDQVAFARSPSLHTAAHEAAHVVQQRAGVELKGGVGQSGDAYEQHADAVANLVVQGQSSQALLDQLAGPAQQRASAVQGKAPRGADAVQRVITNAPPQSDPLPQVSRRAQLIFDKLEALERKVEAKKLPYTTGTEGAVSQVRKHFRFAVLKLEGIAEFHRQVPNPRSVVPYTVNTYQSNGAPLKHPGKLFGLMDLYLQQIDAELDKDPKTDTYQEGNILGLVRRWKAEHEKAYENEENLEKMQEQDPAHGPGDHPVPPPGGAKTRTA